MKKIGLILLALLFALSVCACGENPPSESVAATAEPTSVQPDGTAQTNAVVQGQYESFQYTDSNGESYDAVYSLPELNLSSEDAIAVNEEIKEVYAQDFAEAKAAEQEQKALPCDSISYEAYQNDDVVSIVIKRVRGGHSVDYKVYNFNRAAGKRLDNAGLLSCLERDEETVYALLKQRLQEDYTSKFKPDNFPEDYYIRLEATIGDEAVRSSSLFLNADAELYAICTEHVSIGDKEYHVMLAVE